MKDLMKTSTCARRFNVRVQNDHQEPKVATGCMSRVADMLQKKLKIVSENKLFCKRSQTDPGIPDFGSRSDYKIEIGLWLYILFIISAFNITTFL